MSTPEYAIFQCGDVLLQSGQTFRDAQLAYRAYGTLNADKSNAVLVMTPFTAQHPDIEHAIGSGRALDPDRYFIIIANLFGNGLSSSPSHLQKGSGEWSDFTLTDNVRLQERMLREVFGIEVLELAYGFSMGGMQAIHWAALFPHKVRRFAAVCATAKVSPHNFVFLEGLKAVLSNGAESLSAECRLRTLGRVFAGWAVSQAFYRDKLWRGLGFASLEDYIVGFWETNFLKRHPGNLLAQIHAWQHADVSDNELYRGDLARALGAITAQGLIMPSESDLYVQAEDCRQEASLVPHARFQVIPSQAGHRAGNPPRGSKEEAVIDAALKQLLGN